MIVSLATEKGGAGKSTLSQNLAVEIALRYIKSKILLVDADYQNSTMRWAEKRITRLPSNMSILAMPSTKIHRDILSYKDDYDFIIIDTPGRSTDITRSAIFASDVIIVPCRTSDHDIEATQNTLKILRETTELNKPDLAFFFLINGRQSNTIVGEDLRDRLEKMGDDVFVLTTEIYHRVSWIKTSEGFSVHELKNANPAKLEISNLFIEIENVISTIKRSST